MPGICVLIIYAIFLGEQLYILVWRRIFAFSAKIPCLSEISRMCLRSVTVFAYSAYSSSCGHVFFLHAARVYVLYQRLQGAIQTPVTQSFVNLFRLPLAWN
jgi:hypothetical protein